MFNKKTLSKVMTNFRPLAVFGQGPRKNVYTNMGVGLTLKILHTLSRLLDVETYLGSRSYFLLASSILALSFLKLDSKDQAKPELVVYNAKVAPY